MKNGTKVLIRATVNMIGNQNGNMLRVVTENTNNPIWVSPNEVTEDFLNDSTRFDEEVTEDGSRWFCTACGWRLSGHMGLYRHEFKRCPDCGRVVIR